MADPTLTFTIHDRDLFPKGIVTEDELLAMNRELKVHTVGAEPPGPV
jgi:hypothetical protein